VVKSFALVPPTATVVTCRVSFPGFDSVTVSALLAVFCR